MRLNLFAAPLLALSVALASCAPAAAPEAAPTQTAQQQAGAEVLFWSDAKRSENFRAMEKLFPGTVAKAPAKARILSQGKPLAIPDAEVEAFMKDSSAAGVMVLHDGKVVLERYGLGLGPTDRWTSFSVAKSFTSTLVGAAIRDGHIKSLDDPVVRYIPGLAGSAYDGVNVRQLLTMTSGVKWNEDYTDPNSDVARMLSVPVKPGEDPVVAYMKTLPREAPPGSKWVYKTGETNLVGLLVMNATGKGLSAYAEEKIVKPAGFAGDMFWMTDTIGQEVGGCCLSIRLSDYARMGQWVMEGGKGSVRPDWFADATKEHAPTGQPGFGYGYQWWTFPGGAYGAQGIFGQGIFIMPEKKLVIAILSNWPKATGYRSKQVTFVSKVVAATE